MSLSVICHKTKVYKVLYKSISGFGIHSLSSVNINELLWSSGYELVSLTREVAGSNPGKSHWWMTGGASGPKMLTAPAKFQLTIGHHLAP